ncbi:MAG: hypothetical protein ACJARD_001159 [Alphaproteobacteria bacterium]
MGHEAIHATGSYDQQIINLIDLLNNNTIISAEILTHQMKEFKSIYDIFNKEKLKGFSTLLEFIIPSFNVVSRLSLLEEFKTVGLTGNDFNDYSVTENDLHLENGTPLRQAYGGITYEQNKTMLIDSVKKLKQLAYDKDSPLPQEAKKLLRDTIADIEKYARRENVELNETYKTHNNHYNMFFNPIISG